MSITKKEVERVALLARLALTEAEKESFTLQLGKILDHVKKLQSLDTSSVPPTAHSFFNRTVWREDVASPAPSTESILANAPEREDNFFKVKKVIE